MLVSIDKQLHRQHVALARDAGPSSNNPHDDPPGLNIEYVRQAVSVSSGKEGDDGRWAETNTRYSGAKWERSMNESPQASEARVEMTDPPDSVGYCYIRNLLSVSFPEIADLRTGERSVERPSPKLCCLLMWNSFASAIALENLLPSSYVQ